MATMHDTIDEFQKLLKKANLDDSGAQYDIGLQFYNKKNWVKAREWFQKAAENGHQKAQIDLGKMLIAGHDLPPNMKEGFLAISRAAFKNNSYAQYKIGKMYFLGEGVEQNNDAALIWLKKSADQNYKPACNLLGWIYEKLAFNAYRMGSLLGDDDSQCQLAWMYQVGCGVDKNMKEMGNWYRKSADAGHAYAQFNLGLLYKWNSGISNNQEKACDWFLKAALQGHSLAKNELEMLQAAGILKANETLKLLNAALSQKEQLHDLSGAALVHSSSDSASASVLEKTDVKSLTESAQENFSKSGLERPGVKKLTEISIESSDVKRSKDKLTSYESSSISTNSGVLNEMLPGFRSIPSSTSFNINSSSTNNEGNKKSNDHLTIESASPRVFSMDG